MRRGLLFGSSLVLFGVFAAGPSWTGDESAVDPLAVSMICSNEAASAQPAAAPAVTPPKILPGFGNGAMPIATKSPEAQRWFDHGLQLLWAFQHEPAKAAFAEAARLDPDCAMCAWGQALGDGPTINYGVSAADRAAALKHALRAQALAVNGSEKERALIAAMVRRYSDGDTAYAKAMTELAARWPDDRNIGVFAADSNMVQWKDERLKLAITLLEGVLAAEPDHVGAIHLYIHVTEGLEVPAKAVPYADRLVSLAPAASHLVHMPSHTWYRVGRYREAAFTNLAAIEADKAWVKAAGWSKDSWDIPYYGHNVRFALGGAMMAGEAAAALGIAARYAEVPEASLGSSPWQQAGAGSAWFALGRYGDPDAVLAMKEPGEKLGFLRAMRHYGRGEALARKGDAAGVRAEAALIRPAGPKMLSAQMEIAREVLLGRAAMLEGRYPLAQTHFRKAAARQEKVFGDGGDPPIWWYPTRRSLAAALLAEGQLVPALTQARAVLAKWPNDPLSLAVAARAEERLGRQTVADGDWAKAQAGWGAGSVKAVTLEGI